MQSPDPLQGSQALERVTSVWKCHFSNLFFLCCLPLGISFIWGAVLLTTVNKTSIKFPPQEQGVIVIEARVRRLLVWVVRLFSASPLCPRSLVLMRYYAVGLASTLNINLHCFGRLYSSPTHMSNPFFPSEKTCFYNERVDPRPRHNTAQPQHLH